MTNDLKCTIIMPTQSLWFNTRYNGMFLFGDTFFIYRSLLTKANDIIILKHTISVSLWQLWFKICLFNVNHIVLSLIYRYIIIEALVGLYLDMSCNLAEEECKQSHMHSCKSSQIPCQLCYFNKQIIKQICKLQ